MKILAATPVQYRDTVYIAELTSTELTALAGLTSKYDDIPVVDYGLVKPNELKSGYVIDTKVADESLYSFGNFCAKRDNIAESSSIIREALDTLHTLLNPE